MAPSKQFAIYIAALILVGVGYLSLLPPFEGFDESAHYAALRQVADTGTLPLRGTSFLPRDVTDYQGPTAYTSSAPPFDTGMVYSKFFTSPDESSAFVQTYRQPRQRPPYIDSSMPNWQVQHPPLYYILLAPILKLTNGLSFVAEIFVLRLTSLLLAIGGVALGLVAARRAASTFRTYDADSVTVGFLLYPIMLPTFFPEFARIGNDSLCLFLTGAMAFFLARTLESEDSIRWPLALGATLGLGLLTKALFLPIAAALFIFLLLRMSYGEQAYMPRAGRNLSLVVLPALLVGGSWYMHNFLKFGEWSGGNETLRLAESGGLLANLSQHFSIIEVVRGLAVALVTWIWGGTWSLTRLSPWLYAPMLILILWVMIRFVCKIRTRRIADPVWLPVFLVVVFGGGLLWHIIVSVALDGTASTMGSYLHILMPWTAPAMGIGLCAIFNDIRERKILNALLLYAVVFHGIALWALFALFTGCAWKGEDKYYAFPGHAFCLDQTSLLVERLRVIGWPSLAAIGFGGGIICALWLVARAKSSVVSLHHIER